MHTFKNFRHPKIEFIIKYNPELFDRNQIIELNDIR